MITFYWLIGYTFSADVTAGLDGGEGGNSMVMLGGGWDDWSEVAAQNAFNSNTFQEYINLNGFSSNLSLSIFMLLWQEPTLTKYEEAFFPVVGYSDSG